MAYTRDQLDAADEFSDRAAELEHAIVELKSHLAAAEPISARVFELPRLTRDQEEEPVTFVEPSALTGPEAFSLGSAAFSDWYGVEGYSTKAVHRLPGVLSYRTSNPARILAAVDRCNQLKQAIKEVVPRLGNRDDRFELIHARHRMLILLQLTRQITALACPPAIRSATFTWGFKTEIYKLSLDEACRVLETYRKRPGLRSEDGMPWEQRVNQEIVRLRSLPANVELRHRRPLKVRPLVNVRYILSAEEKSAREQALARGERVSQPVKLYEGHTPLIILNPPSGMSIGNLGVFSAEARSRRAPRKGLKTGAHPITGIGSIYLVERQDSAGDDDDWDH